MRVVSVSVGISTWIYLTTILLFSSTSSFCSSPSSSSSSSCFRLPRWRRSVIVLLLSCALSPSSLVCFPYSAMTRHNMPGQWTHPSFAVRSAHQVQWFLFVLIDFIALMQTGYKGKWLCVFQVNLWLGVQQTHVDLSVNLAQGLGTLIPTTCGCTAYFVTPANVSNCLWGGVLHYVYVRPKLCDSPTF